MSSATLPPTTSNRATLPATTTADMTSTSAPNTSTTPAPVASRCEYGCYQDFVEMSGCHERCPGASCLDDTGCEDPYPCISSTCCHTGCLPDWSCNGWCAGPLTCVSAPSTVTTAVSTCSGTG
ncbi:hypothetical protein F5X97DRAFT_298976 [Nemania serpens]|nr:hypothetical protein F5X97DRAFT_298976 [Nemania serpens]